MEHLLLGLGYFHFVITQILATIARLFFFFFRRLTCFLGTSRMSLDQSGSFASSSFRFVALEARHLDV